MKRSNKIILGVALTCIVLMTLYAARQIYTTGFWRGPDVVFGDQHLKTTVALIELHRVRYGKYPADLSELKFTGAWDAIETDRVRYRANSSQTRYCLEVQRGWVAKPQLQMPAEFWQGTGYDPSLCRW